MASVVSEACDTCRTCAYAHSCTEQAIVFLEGQGDTPLMRTERMRLARVSQALASAPREQGGATPAEQQPSALQGLAPQVASAVKKLLRTGWFEFARREMRSGRNPGRNDWQRILCDGLIAGGIARANLQLAFQQQMNLTPGSAKVRTSKAVATFLAGGLLVERNGLLSLRQN